MSKQAQGIRLNDQQKDRLTGETLEAIEREGCIPTVNMNQLAEHLYNRHKQEFDEIFRHTHSDSIERIVYLRDAVIRKLCRDGKIVIRDGMAGVPGCMAALTT